MTKLSPSEYTKEELQKEIAESIHKLESTHLTVEQRGNLERKIATCQNQLMLFALVESNENLVIQQQTLSQLLLENIETSKRTSKEAKWIIGFTILTLVLTAILDLVHMNHEKEQLETIIHLITK